MEQRLLINQKPPLDETNARTYWHDIAEKESNLDECINEKWVQGNKVDRLQLRKRKSSFTDNEEEIEILEEKPDIITIKAAEVPKSPCELNFIKHIMEEEEQKHLEEASSSCEDFSYRKTGEKYFQSFGERAIHEQNEHNNFSRTIKCNFCNLTFNSFFELTRHMPAHRNDQRYICSFCSKCFHSSKELKIHRKISEYCQDINSNPQKAVRILQQPKIQQPKPLTEPPITDISHLPKISLKTLPDESKSVQSGRFAEEVKAFASKYQLKSTSVVAKKRTSPLVVDMIPHKRKRKCLQTEIFQDYVEKPQYAIPIAIDMNSNVGHPFLNVKIKEEPIDEDYNEHIVTGVDPVMFGDVHVKNEPLDDYVEIKNEPFGEEPTMETFLETSLKEKEYIVPDIDLKDNIKTERVNITSESSQKADAKMSQPCTKDERPTVKRFKIIKIFSKNSPNIKKELFSSDALTKNNTTSSMPLKPLKIIKLAPNSKIIKLPALKCESSVENSNGEVLKKDTSLNSTISIKLPTQKSNAPQQGDMKIKVEGLKNSIQNLIHDISLRAADIHQRDKSLQEENLLGTDIEQKRADISESVTKLLEETIQIGNEFKGINYVPKEVLRFIEQQPQKVKVIQELQRKMILAQQASLAGNAIKKEINNDIDTINMKNNNQDLSVKWEKLNGKSLITHQRPSSLFLTVINNNRHDIELSKARREYPNYRFSWLCPKCPRQYEQKHAFISHLVMHGLCRDEFENLFVEVRPFLIENAKTVSQFSPEQKIKFEEAKINDATSNLSNQEDDQNTKTNPSKTKRHHQCPRCERFCSSRSMLIDHLRANCSREPPYPCTQCPKAFFTSGSLNCHMTIHTGELPHKCSYCDKRFRTRGQVTVHHRTHTGERPFVCQVCSQGFTHRETLISHLSRHIGMKRYRCYACNKHFACVSGLKIHRDNRPTTCGLVKLNTRAIGPRVRVIRGQVHFEPQPVINPYLRTEDPQEILSEIQNIQKSN